MTHRQSWHKTERLATVKECEAAAQEAATLAPDSSSEDLVQCAKVLQRVLDNEVRLKEIVDSLKPGTKRTHSTVSDFTPNRPPLSKLNGVFIFIALTKLDNNAGMFSFLSPLDESEWKEEEVTLEPGYGLIWRGDCRRKAGKGNGGIMLVIRYE